MIRFIFIISLFLTLVSSSSANALATKSINISPLPRELKLSLMEYLTIKELFALMLTCKEFNTIANHDFIWTKIVKKENLYHLLKQAKGQSIKEKYKDINDRLTYKIHKTIKAHQNQIKSIERISNTCFRSTDSKRTKKWELKHGDYKCIENTLNLNTKKPSEYNILQILNPIQKLILTSNNTEIQLEPKRTKIAKGIYALRKYDKNTLYKILVIQKVEDNSTQTILQKNLDHSIRFITPIHKNGFIITELYNKMTYYRFCNNSLNEIAILQKSGEHYDKYVEKLDTHVFASVSEDGKKIHIWKAGLLEKHA